MGSRALSGCLLALVAAVITGCGGSGLNLDPARIVPPHPLVFAEFGVGPGGVNRAAVSSVLDRLVGDAGERVLFLLANQELKRLGLSFRRDLRTWIGPTVAVVVVQQARSGIPPAGSNVALILPARDPGLARKQLMSALSRHSGGIAIPAHFGRVQYWYDAATQTSLAIVGNYAIFGGQTAMDQIVAAAHSHSLATTEQHPRSQNSGAAILRIDYDPRAVAELFANYLYDLSGPFVINTTSVSRAECTAFERRLLVEGTAQEQAIAAALECLFRGDKPQRQIIAATRKLAIRHLSKYSPGTLYFVSVARSHRRVSATFIPDQFEARFFGVARSLLMAVFGGRHPALIPSG
jgi:hypothetical protein